MPTITKLAALVLFAVLAMLGVDWYVALLPEPPQNPRLGLLLGVIGAATGWMFVGGQITGAPLRGVWIGLQGALLTILSALVVVSVVGVFQGGYRRQYDGVMEALMGAFEIALVHGQRMLDPDFLLRVGAGGAVCGVMLAIIFRLAEARRLDR